MNCKPGDLAVIVSGDFSENIGKLVKVNHDSTQWFDSTPMWDCEALSPIYGELNDLETGDSVGEGLGHAGELIDVPDADLRPIRPDSVTDSEVRDLYEPKPIKEVA